MEKRGEDLSKETIEKRKSSNDEIKELAKEQLKSLFGPPLFKALKWKTFACSTFDD